MKTPIKFSEIVEKVYERDFKGKYRKQDVVEAARRCMEGLAHFMSDPDNLYQMKLKWVGTFTPNPVAIAEEYTRLKISKEDEKAEKLKEVFEDFKRKTKKNLSWFKTLDKREL